MLFIPLERNKAKKEERTINPIIFKTERRNKLSRKKNFFRLLIIF